MAPADLGRLVLLAAAWGLAFVFIRVAVAPLGPIALVELRQVIAGSVLLLYLASIGVALDVRSRWRKFLALALLNSALPFTLIATAQQILTASHTVILVATSPLFAAMIAAVVLAEPLTARKVAGLALGVVGVALLVGWHRTAEAPPPAWAIGFVLAAALLYAIAGIYTRVAAQGIPPLATAAGSQLAAALLLVPLVPFSPPAAMPSALAWGAVLALALFSSALAFILYFQLIRNIGPVRTLTVNFLTPLFGVGGGVLLLGERFTANVAAGAAVVLGATWLVIAGPGPARR